MKQVLLLLLITSITFLRAQANAYYVNDATYNASDSYSTAPGSAGGTGAKSSPKLTIQSVVALGLLPGDTVYIDGGTFAEDFSVTVSGTSAARIVFLGNGTTKTFVQGVSGGVNYTINLTNASYITFKNIKVVSVPTEWAFQVYNDSDNNIITDCETDADQYSVDILRASGGAGAPSPDNNVVKNCLLNSKYVGVRIKSNNLSTWAGSAAVGPLNNVIQDNIINVSSATVYAAVEMQAARSNSILRNKISSTGNTDVGTIAIIHSCSGEIIQNNYVINHSAKGSGAYFNPAIFFDDNSGASLIHNSFYAISYAFYFGDGGGSGTLTNVDLLNNIFYSSLKDCISFPLDASAKFNKCDGNMYFAPAGNIASVTTTNMDFAAWKAYLPGAGNEANGYNADPSYNSPGSNNLDLNSGSPAIDVVNIATSVANDIYATVRPQGAKKDIGAYETVTLPIKLFYFKAGCEADKVSLTWIVSELNNDYFVVEKSESAKGDFTEVTRIDGRHNNAAVNTYQYIDTYTSASYYRLKQVDLNGDFTYSYITHTTCSSQEVIVINSNDNIEVICPNAQQGDMIAVRITSLTGQVITERELSLSSERNVNLPVSSLASSLYIIMVTIDNEVYSTKFIKED